MRFDFLGTPLLVLAMMPLRLASYAFFAAALGPAMLWWAQNGAGGDVALPAELAATTGTALIAWGGMVLFCEATMWGSALGAVTREVMANARRRNRLTWVISREAFALRLLLFSWSWALWSGLVLGGWDALTGRNGHRRG